MILKVVVALVLIGHGIGHVTGLMAALTKQGGFAPRPWLLSSNVTMQSPIGKVFGVLWLVAAILFVASGVTLLTGGVWWPWLPVAAALVSLLVVLPWWNTVVPGAKAGALLDLLVLLALVPGWREQVMAALGAS